MVTKQDVARKVRELCLRDGNKTVRWAVAYRTAEQEREVCTLKDFARVVQNGRKPVPEDTEGLVDWIWEEVSLDPDETETEWNAFLVDYARFQPR